MYFIKISNLDGTRELTLISNTNASKLLDEEYCILQYWLSIPHSMLMTDISLFYSVSVRASLNPDAKSLRLYKLNRYIRIDEATTIPEILKKNLSRFSFF